MVEHAVQHDPDATVLAGVKQRVKCLISTQQRIDQQVVVRVIAMVRGRLEDGVEVKRGDAEVDQVVKFLDHSEEIAALVPKDGRVGIPRFDAGRLDNLVTLGKAVRKDLVKDGIS